MPKVGKKKFPYTEKGKKDAEEERKKKDKKGGFMPFKKKGK